LWSLSSFFSRSFASRAPGARVAAFFGVLVHSRESPCGAPR
jgi:hypothetical protein